MATVSRSETGQYLDCRFTIQQSVTNHLAQRQWSNKRLGCSRTMPRHDHNCVWSQIKASETSRDTNSDLTSDKVNDDDGPSSGCWCSEQQ
jgi:hypothetical protein